MRRMAMKRRVAVCTFLFIALTVSGVGWAETPHDTRVVDSAVTLSLPPGPAIEAALTGRSDAVTAGWSDQRLAKARVRLGLAVLVGLSVVVAAAVVALARPLPAPGSTLWRRWSVTLRAPPLLRLS